MQSPNFQPHLTVPNTIFYRIFYHIYSNIYQYSIFIQYTNTNILPYHIAHFYLNNQKQ